MEEFVAYLMINIENQAKKKSNTIINAGKTVSCREKEK